jgi:CheY-like chemotaxis protein
MKEKMKVFLIDDDQDDQEIFCMAVESVNKDIMCITVSDCVEALSMLKADKELMPDFIFIDVNMPKMNGIECLTHLVTMEHLKVSKIYMYSTTSEENSVKTCKQLGAIDFIVKPPSIVVLREKLSEIFNA